MHRIKSKAGAFGGMTITAIGPQQALEKAHELSDHDGLTDVVIVDPNGDEFTLAEFEKRMKERSAG
jgi:hypothetical protein